MKHFFEQVPGWFGAGYRQAYRDAVERLADGDIVVELGVWKGKSTAFLAVAIANSGKRVKFYAVDSFVGCPGDAGRDRGDELLATFRSNMEAGGALGSVRLIVGDSAGAAEQFADGSVAFVFVDAGHTTRAVRRDLAAWTPKICPGGTIAGHDFHRSGVRVAVLSRFPLAKISVSADGNVWTYRRAD